MSYEFYEGHDYLGYAGSNLGVKQMKDLAAENPELKDLNGFFESGVTKNPRGVVSDIEKLKEKIKVPRDIDMSLTGLWGVMRQAKKTVRLSS